MYIVNLSASRKNSGELTPKGELVSDFIGAVDQGTTSTRFMVFDHSGAEVARHQLEHAQILPRPRGVEHDPAEIWERTATVVGTALHQAGLRTADLAALGLTNPRENT